MYARSSDIIHFNEKLVELVGQNNCLYDNNTEGYSNPQVQDEIWRKIAAELNEDVAACKLKWKNIRTCYIRYLRQLSSQKSKLKRTYYLASQLTFLLPFCKPNSRRVSDTFWSDESSILQYDDELDPLTKTEPVDDDDEPNTKLEPSINFDGNSSDGMQSNNELYLNKRPQWDPKTESTKRRKTEDRDEPELDFFKSLLPDIRKMDGKQKNRLKMAVLSAINDILYSDKGQAH